MGQLFTRIKEKIHAAKRLLHMERILEQMEERETCRYDEEQIRSLRQKKKVLILGTCEHRNIGDAAITYAEQEVLLAQFPEYEQFEISTYEMGRKHAFLHAIVNDQDILMIHGGGNIGSLYKEEEDLHRLILTEFPFNKVIMLPQTIWFEDTPHGRKELERSKEVYNRHGDLTIFTRGDQSLRFAKEHFTHANVYLMPDMMMYRQRLHNLPRSGILACLRTDEEGVLGESGRKRLLERIAAVGEPVEVRTNMAEEDVRRSARAQVVRAELRTYAGKKVVVTDRLHGMIFCAVTGTPCVVIRMQNWKITEFYEAFLKDSSAVFFAKDSGEDVENLIRQAMALERPAYPIFQKKMLDEIRRLSGC